ncbi:FmdB family zinc ribbon protein [Microbacterium sp. ZXX196]|uniref:FmdB family zinc ribbon protein n=1 Tax=Microbacterium sp. ZXX196 TaxID=2609291 RepID=UPI0012B6F16D|nr:FmdB family zinc ribbon protein [Microbacterium sp. ZXX196]MTE23395.1 FmdB family transcriptional regulator [Microbacterium sp. ZXX196]
MPTYAYACKDCGHAFDAVQSFSDASLTECPACGGALRKQYGSIGVTFNGSGFYRTDARASTGAAEGKSAAAPASSSQAASTSGSSGAVAASA